MSAISNLISTRGPRLVRLTLMTILLAVMPHEAPAQFKKPAATGQVLRPRLRLQSDDTNYAVVFSPDGQLVATSSGHDFKLWNVSTGRLIMTFKFNGNTCTACHTGRVNYIAFSPDGKRLATASDDTTAKLWDTVSGKYLAQMAGTEEPVQSVAFSPDGKTVATGGAVKGDGEVQIWDLSGGPPKLAGSLHIEHSGTIMCVAYSPDGKTLATADYGHPWVRLWDAATGVEKKKIELPAMDSSGQYESLHRIAFSPNGQLIAIGGNQAGRIINLATGKIIATLPHGDAVRAVAFSGDGRLVATASMDKTAKIWDVTTGNIVATLEGHINGLNAIAFSPDSRLIVTGAEGLSLLWDVPAR